MKLLFIVTLSLFEIPEVSPNDPSLLISKSCFHPQHADRSNTFPRVSSDFMRSQYQCCQSWFPFSLHPTPLIVPEYMIFDNISLHIDSKQPNTNTSSCVFAYLYSIFYLNHYAEQVADMDNHNVPAYLHDRDMSFSLGIRSKSPQQWTSWLCGLGRPFILSFGQCNDVVSSYEPVLMKFNRNLKWLNKSLI